jgi:hypothetical protein
LEEKTPAVTADVGIRKMEHQVDVDKSRRLITFFGDNTMAQGFWRVGAKLTQANDQIISAIRDEYKRLKPAHKELFKTWVIELTKIDPLPPGFGGSANGYIQLTVDGAEEREEIRVSPATLAAAIEAWDKNDYYIHKGLL